MSARYIKEQQLGYEGKNITYIRHMYTINSDLGGRYTAPLSKRPSTKIIRPKVS